MGSGKGGGSSDQGFIADPTYVDPVDGTTYNSAAALNEHIAIRKEQERNDSLVAADKKTNEDITAQNTFNTNRDTAYNDAVQSVLRSFNAQGIDPNQYWKSDIEPTLTATRNSIQNLDANPAGAFPSTLGDTIITDLTKGKRSRATTDLNSIFTPNYSSNLITDTADDPYIDKIVNEQFDPLNTQLQNAQRRGILTSGGYDAALDTLGQKKSAARSQVSDLGSNILSTDRKGIDDLISGAKTSASGLGLSDAFDPASFGTQAASKASDYLGGLEGSLRSAVGGTKFADINELINAGGTFQGATNPVANVGNAALVGTSVEDLTKQKRGLGNTGAF